MYKLFIVELNYWFDFGNGKISGVGFEFEP